MNAVRYRNILIPLSAVLVAACQPLLMQESTESAAPAPQPTCECPPPVVSPEVCPPAPEPQPVVVQPCPAPTGAVKSKEPPKPGQGLLVIGRVEYVFVNREGSTRAPLKLKARIDTGAGLTSMHAYSMVEFERDGDPWVRFGLLQPKSEKPVFFERPVKRYVNIKEQSGGADRRPVVRMSFKLGDIEESVEVTLTDRSDYLYQVLVGRNFLRDRAVVDVRRKFIADDIYHQN